mmetsp:Transcript_103796/g.317880  ORF Transcript_103796/g.317880 Transcript_103796/m.317880 type:complete len:245 (+) Transcript_103796:736-1470(+)
MELELFPVSRLDQLVVLDQFFDRVVNDLPNALRRALLATGHLDECLPESVDLIEERILDGGGGIQPLGWLVAVARQGGEAHSRCTGAGARPGAGLRLARRLRPVDGALHGPVPANERAVDDEDSEGATKIEHRLGLQHLTSPMLREAQMRRDASVLDLDALPAQVHEAPGDTSRLQHVRLDENLAETLPFQALSAWHEQHRGLTTLRGTSIKVLEAGAQYSEERVLHEILCQSRHGRNTIAALL